LELPKRKKFGKRTKGGSKNETNKKHKLWEKTKLPKKTQTRTQTTLPIKKREPPTPFPLKKTYPHPTQHTPPQLEKNLHLQVGKTCKLTPNQGKQPSQTQYGGKRVLLPFIGDETTGKETSFPLGGDSGSLLRNRKKRRGAKNSFFLRIGDNLKKKTEKGGEGLHGKANLTPLDTLPLFRGEKKGKKVPASPFTPREKFGFN